MTAPGADTASTVFTWLHMAFVKQFLWKPLIRKTHDPRITQWNVLQGILERNKDTSFGKEHGFATITSYREFRHAVPVNDYEALRSYIDRQEVEKAPHLNPQQPVMYAQTSGTSGKPKYIPVQKHTISQYRRSQHIVAYTIYAAIPDVYRGKILAIVAPAVEGHLESGTPYGSMSGIIDRSMPQVVKKKYVVPPRSYREIGWSAISASRTGDTR